VPRGIEGLASVLVSAGGARPGEEEIALADIRIERLKETLDLGLRRQFSGL
jgi:hypothetical protein